MMFATAMGLTKISYPPNDRVIIIDTKHYIYKNEVLKFILESIQGVENVYNTSKYSVSIEIGNMFDRDEMAKVLQIKIEEFIIENTTQPSTCPHCQQLQHSIADRKYLELFKNCWSCDKLKWSKGELTLEEFERREKESVK